MYKLKAQIHQGRLKLDEPYDAPEGTEVDLAIVDMVTIWMRKSAPASTPPSPAATMKLNAGRLFLGFSRTADAQIDVIEA